MVSMQLKIININLILIKCLNYQKILALKTKRELKNMLIKTFEVDHLVCDLSGHIMKIQLTYISIQGKENEWYKIKC